MIANENVADESAMLNITRESLASHTDVPNWHTVKMMPLHGVCEPIHLTALMQIRYFAKYKFRKTAGKFYFNLHFNELNNAQEPLEETDPGSTRDVWREKEKEREREEREREREPVNTELRGHFTGCGPTFRGRTVVPGTFAVSPQIHSSRNTGNRPKRGENMFFTNVPTNFLSLP